MRKFLWIHDHVADIGLRGPRSKPLERLWNCLLDSLQSLLPASPTKVSRLALQTQNPEETRLFFSFL
jgi:hypothetical protein